jgi:hypothetical protein
MMQRLSLRERPARRPLASDAFWVGCTTLAIMTLGAYAATTHAPRITVILLMYATSMMVIWGISAVSLYLDRDYNRSLPRHLENHLSGNLVQEDWEQLRQSALQHPEVRPWISDAIKNGDLTYQEAEPLVARINQYIADQRAPCRQPHVSLNSQQKLLRLLQGGTATGGTPDDGGHSYP